MSSPLLLLVLLLALAGIIAYAGDRLGTLVGRRRLSVFGWRPRRTGQAVGVAAGVLIMLVTMGVLSLAFRDATAVLLRSQRTARELADLRTQQRALAAQVANTARELAEARATGAEAEAAKDQARAARDAALRIRDRTLAEQEALQADLAGLEVRTRTLTQQQARLRADNAALGEANAELSLSNESLSARNAELSAQNRRFQRTFNDLQTEVVTLNDRLTELRTVSEREAQGLRDTLAQFAEASGSELTYREGEIVYSDLIAAQNVPAISAALQAFVTGARAEATGRGASDVLLSAEQLNSLIGALAATPGEDLVVLYAADNFAGTAQVQVNVDARDNRRLLQRGQLVATRQLYAGGDGAPVSRAGLRAEVARLTQGSLDRLQRIGLFEQVRPAPSEAELDSFTASLARLSGPVVIGALARADVYVAGPAELEFIILY